MKYLISFLFIYSAYSSEVVNNKIKPASFENYSLGDEVMKCYNNPSLKRINYNPLSEYYLTVTTHNNEEVIFMRDKRGKNHILPFSSFKKEGEYNVSINGEAYKATKYRNGKIKFVKGGTLSDMMVDFNEVKMTSEIMGGIRKQFLESTELLSKNPEKHKSDIAVMAVKCTMLGIKYEDKLLVQEMKSVSDSVDSNNRSNLINDIRKRIPASHGGEGGGGVGASASEK